MAISIGQIDRAKLAAMYAHSQGVNAVPQSVNFPSGSSVETPKIDTALIEQIAKRNASEKIGVPTTQGTTQVQQPVVTQGVEAPKEVAGVDAKTATRMFGKQTVMPSVAKYNGFAASGAYGKTVQSGKNSDYGIYDALANFKNNGAKPDNGVFVAQNNVNQNSYTAGLNFGGLTKLNPANKLYDIA